jgi:uncharacterized protein (TIGR03000 family)
MFKNSLACVGIIALATVALLAVPVTSEGGPLGLRGAGVGATYNNSVSPGTAPDVYYYQPNSADMNTPRVGLLRRLLGRNNYAATSYVPVPAANNTVTTSTSGYKPGDATTDKTDKATTTTAAPATVMTVDPNPPRMGLLRRLFNRRSATTTTFVNGPAGDSTTTSTSGYRPGDATTAPSSSTAFAMVDPNPPRFPLFRRLLNRNNIQPTPNTFVATGSDGVTYSTSGYRPGDTANMPRTGDDRAHLRIALPAERAEVWIEGQKSEQGKRVEDYVSPPLTPGKQYFYEVRARWTDAAGKEVERTRSFPIVPGQPVLLDFSRATAKEEATKK